MKPVLVILFVAVLIATILWSEALSFGQCPIPNDSGICDTLFAEVYPPDTLFTGVGHFVRVPFYITHDLITEVDSLKGTAIPLCFIHSNPSKYCSTSSYWNRAVLTGPDVSRSIFRHFNGIHNWMMDQFEEGNGEEWDSKIINVVNGNNFWFQVVATGSEDQGFGGGSKVLWFTMTLQVEDTMTICIDTCFWPACCRYGFTNADAQVYPPRDNMPYCFFVSPPKIGDVNADDVINSADVILLINYLYRGGLAPVLLWLGDANCDQIVNASDVIVMINHLFRGGPTPSC